MAINGSINLMKYVGARKVSISGEKGVFIPLDENPTIFNGTKGVYASVRVVEHESEFDGKTYTHFIAASLNKEKREELEAEYDKDEMKKFTPILGNMVDYNAASYEDVDAEDVEEEDDDMPLG